MIADRSKYFGGTGGRIRPLHLSLCRRENTGNALVIDKKGTCVRICYEFGSALLNVTLRYLGRRPGRHFTVTTSAARVAVAKLSAQTMTQPGTVPDGSSSAILRR